MTSGPIHRATIVAYCGLTPPRARRSAYELGVKLSQDAGGGGSVRGHLHVHVVPRKKGDGLKGFFWPRRKYDDDAHASNVAKQIREKLSGSAAAARA